MNSPAADSELFGVWLMTGGSDHYYLNGKALCSTPYIGSQKRPPTFNGGVNISLRCERCHKLNLERWLRGGR